MPMPRHALAPAALALALTVTALPLAAGDPFSADAGAEVGRIVGTINGAPAEWTIRERANLMRESVVDEMHPGALHVYLVAFPDVPGDAPPESYLFVNLHVEIHPETREHVGHTAGFVSVSSTDFMMVDEAYRAADPLEPFAITRWEPQGERIVLAATLERRLEPQENAFAASVIETPGDLELRLEIEADLRFAPYDG
jgi:hypothetical protein